MQKNKCELSVLKMILNTLLLGAAAAGSHFLYQLSDNNIVVGLFNPVNESVWEHLKLMFFPLLIWWVIVYIIKRKKCNLPSGQWVVVSAASLIAAPLSVLALHYMFTGIFGSESVIFDIVIVFIAYFTSLRFANHLIKYPTSKAWQGFLAFIVVIIIFVAFFIFTFATPKIPLFYDSTTGTYGV